MVTTRKQRARQGGSALLEVLIASVVIGITVIGLSLMLSLGQAMVVGQGDDYVALYLAQQRIEDCIATRFQNPPTCTTNGLGTETETICYNCATAVPVGELGTQTFTRVTTITYSGAPIDTEQVSVTVTPSLKKADPVTLVTVLKDTS